MKKQTKNKKLYIIATVQRSGSSWLCEMLGSLGIGNPEEHLLKLARKYFKGKKVSKKELRETFQDIKDNNIKNNIVGIKLMWNQCNFLQENFDEDLDKLLKDFFEIKEIKWIFLEREDKIRQAISNLKMQQRKNKYGRGNHIPHAQNKEDLIKVRKTTYEYSFRGIDDLRMRTEEHYKEWRNFFKKKNISPLEITYEELKEDRARCLEKIANFLDIDFNEKDINFKNKKVSSELDKEWKKSYLKDKKRQSAVSKYYHSYKRKIKNILRKIVILKKLKRKIFPNFTFG